MVTASSRAVARRLATPAIPRGWPLHWPGMPVPGPDFLAAARRLGDDVSSVSETKVKQRGMGKTLTVKHAHVGAVLQHLYEQALRTPGFRMPVGVRGGSEVVEFVPGHLWGQHYEHLVRAATDVHYRVPPVDGPRPSDVMVIGKMPGREEVYKARNFVGPSGEQLMASLERMRVTGMDSWYITNVCKFLPPEGFKDILAAWLADCLPLLHMELRIVRPKAILCLGADAAKAVLGKKAKLAALEGRVVDWSFPVHRPGEPERLHHCAVMAVVHPVNAIKDDAAARSLDDGVVRFGMVARGHRFDKEEQGVDHRLVESLDDARKWAREALAELRRLPKFKRMVAWDAEWHGRRPFVDGAYLRTVQCSWAPKKAVVFRLRGRGGEAAFAGGQGALFRLLDDFCRISEARAVGHFLVNDLEWLHHNGFDPTKYCKVPVYDADDGTPAWKRLWAEGGWLDTSAMSHAVEETGRLGLEVLAVRHTTAPRYDLPLEEWRNEYCAENGLKKQELEGYGECPDETLEGVRLAAKLPWGTALENSYAAYDADVTLRIARKLWPLLEKDYQGNCAWQGCWDTMIAQAPILEMRKTGIMIDTERVATLTDAFLVVRDQKLKELQKCVNWGEKRDAAGKVRDAGFNPRSVQQVREFLYGPELNGKEWENGKPVPVLPPGSKVLGLTPLFDTSKPSRTWDEVVEAGRERMANPSTAKSTLAILCAEVPGALECGVGALRDYRYLDQVIKSVLRPPKGDDDGYVQDEETGELIYDGGLMRAIDQDGRIRTTLQATTETGRWRSFRPNLQNWSKTRDEDYKRLLKDGYKHKLRSVAVATPGYCLVEFDYIGAELAVTAFMSGDKVMMDHVRRSGLPEDHPDYYDIHSNVAVLAFRLKCPPTKRGLKEAKASHFRTLAKNVMFGLMYGRSARAIAAQARETRSPGDPMVTEEDAQAIIDTIYGTYKRLRSFFEGARERAVAERWLRHAFGRLRRFPFAHDKSAAGEFGRQAMNFPIQGAVASIVNRGLANLLYIRDEVLKTPDLFRLVLQIHDAVIIEVPYAYVDYVVTHVIPAAMVGGVPFWPTDLAGNLKGTGPYHLDLETVVMPRWGERYTQEECRRIGIPETYGVAA